MVQMSQTPAVKRFARHRLGSSVHAILWNEWDPIGVNGMFGRLVEIDPDTGAELGPAPPDIADQEWPDDEYDSYVWGVLSLLDKGKDAHRIAEYLDQITTHTIGLPWDDSNAMNARHRELAEKIVALRDG
jgi:hypothetical protein